MSNYDAILKQLQESNISEETAKKAAKLITQGFHEPSEAALRNGWTGELAKDFIRWAGEFGEDSAISELQKVVIN